MLLESACVRVEGVSVDVIEGVFGVNGLMWNVNVLGGTVIEVVKCYQAIGGIVVF